MKLQNLGEKVCLNLGSLGIVNQLKINGGYIYRLYVPKKVFREILFVLGMDTHLGVERYLIENLSLSKSLILSDNKETCVLMIRDLELEGVIFQNSPGEFYIMF